MTRLQKTKLSDIRIFVSDFISKNVDTRFVFHNLRHTKDVVNAVKTISRYYKLHKNDYFALLIAAWFHDTGFDEGKIQNHETVSADIATNFLKQKVNKQIISKVVSCIKATRLPQMPSTLIERILCDADLFHLGTSCFAKRTQLLKKETEFYFGKQIFVDDWQTGNIDFLYRHKYFTKYGKKRLQPRIDKWIHNQKLLRTNR